MATSQLFKDFIVHYKKGDRIYSAGDPGTEMYIVQNGSVEIFKGSEGTRVSLAIMEKGDFFGEMALIESAPHSTNSEALEECELIEINSTLFDKMIKGNIEIAVRMLRKLSIRLRDATRRVEELTTAPREAAAQGPAPHEQTALLEPAAAASMPSTLPAIAEPPAAAPLVPDAPTPSPLVNQEGSPPLAMIETPAITTTPAHPNGCHAIFVSEDGRDLFYVTSDRAAIGRYDPVTGLKPEVDLSTFDLNRSVSRHHARLTREGRVYYVTEEMGALNGTFINGKKLLSGKPSAIASGDSLSLGMVKLIFRVRGEAA